jgi:tetratricopeptide (TPR) repeat protein
MRIAVLAVLFALAPGGMALALDSTLAPADTPLPDLAAPPAREAPATGTDQGADQPIIAPLSRDEQLDQLFQALKTAPDDDAANAAEHGIEAIWLKSGSDTVDLLMRWAMQAIDDKDYPTALDYLDRVTTMKPDYAEGWNKQATVRYLTNDTGGSLADIKRVLVLEPRQFEALAGLGSIFRDLGDDKRALVAFRQALAIDPHLEDVQKAVDDIVKKGTDGRDL